MDSWHPLSISVSAKSYFIFLLHLFFKKMWKDIISFGYFFIQTIIFPEGWSVKKHCHCYLYLGFSDFVCVILYSQV